MITLNAKLNRLERFFVGYYTLHLFSFSNHNWLRQNQDTHPVSNIVFLILEKKKLF